MSTLTTVIFDLDGTLIDSEGDLRTAANLMLSDFGCAALSEGEFRGMIGDGTAALVSRALAARQCTDAEEPGALQRFLQHYESNVTALTRPYPGVPDVLETLRARDLKLGLCTNKPLKLTRLILKRLALDDYFTQVVAGDALPYR